MLCFVLPRLVHAAYEPEKLGDSSRRWAVDVNLVESYNDNINTTTTNQLSGLQSYGAITLKANIPAGQTFFRMNGTYGLTYSPDRTTGKIDQSVVFDGLLSHTFTPRLVLDLNETVRYALEPAVADIVGGQSIQLQQQGNFIQNNTDATISYGLSRRWLMSLRGGWDLLRYDSSNVASNNDRDVYSGGMNLAYRLTPRTFVGSGYSYSVNNYTTPGSNDLRNSTSQALYGSFRHTFNPRLSVNVDAGGEVDNFGDGSQNTAPYADMALNYNYSKDATASLGFRYGTTATDLGSFRSTDTGTLFGQVNYQFTLKLRAALNGFLSYSTYQNPVPNAFAPGSPIPKGQDTFQAELTVTYDFNRWSSASLTYSYSDVNADIAGNSFTRNQIGFGVSLRY